MSSERAGVFLGMIAASLIYLPIGVYVFGNGFGEMFERSFWTLFGALVMGCLAPPHSPAETSDPA